MFPWLAYGHISPFLELAKKLADRGGIYIYLCSTAINLNSISKKILGKYSDSIELVEFHLPNLPEFPPHYHTTNALPRRLLPTLVKALVLSKPQLNNVIEALKPDLVMYDVALHMLGISPPDNIPSLLFSIFNATFLSFMSHFYSKPGIEYPFPEIYLRDFELRRFYNFNVDGRTPPPDSVIRDHRPMLVNTCRNMEAKYLDYAASFGNGRIYPVGPLIQYPDETQDKEDDGELINWLRQKNACSTVYVSFGSECVLTKEEIKEIALGLELSKVNFIWVLRFPKGEELTGVKEILPEGFLDRVKERGRIVQGWAPQARILGQSSIGGFITHCGGNSVLECIEFGVPIIAIPMDFEHPLNARLMVSFGVAVEVTRDENQKFRGVEIAEVIKDVVTRDVGKVMRQKMKDLSKNMKSSQEEDLDGVVRMLALLSERSSN